MGLLRSRRAHVCGWLAMMAIAACGFSPNLRDGTIACGPSGACPPGLVCAPDGMCRASFAPAASAAPTDSTPAAPASPGSPDANAPADRPVVSVADVRVPEGNAGGRSATFTVTLSAPSAAPVSVDWSTGDASAVAGRDYVASRGTLTFAPGETKRSFAVPIVGDTAVNGDRAFFVTLGNLQGEATTARGQATCTIVDDDGPVSISIDDVTANEGNAGLTTFRFHVELSAPFGAGPVTVDFATANDSAARNVDYLPCNGTLTFPPDETEQTIDVSVVGDTLNEDNMRFFVNLSAPTNATIAIRQGVGMIVDDDPMPAVSISDATAAVPATGTNPATFTVSLSAPSGREVDVTASTKDDTATEPRDYMAKSQQLKIPAGQTAATFSVSVVKTAVAGGRFRAELQNPVNTTIARGVGYATITP